MRRFLVSLLSGDETEVDAVVFCTIMGLLSLIGIQIFAAYCHPDLFSPGGFASSVLMVIGAGGATKTGRDTAARLTQGQADQPPKP